MEKAILVGLTPSINIYFEESMKELENLALACEIEVVGNIIQKADTPTSNYYIGSGKTNEVRDLITTMDANLVIFDDELTPTHIRNLEAKLDCKVIDRTILILDIFARRAKTKEAMLQVELAQAKYFLPRVIGMNKSMSRQKSGVGSKGPGEQQLELDRRILRDKINFLQNELKEVTKVRRTQRAKRLKSDIPTVALCGYTNSGKSTLMNSILQFSSNKNEKYVFEKNMLFATLETQTRNIILENNHSFLLTDTVGFISKLPHSLIEAFKSTLEEIKEASLILHVIDISNPFHEEQVNTVNQVLKEIGVEDIPMIYVLNKIDQLSDFPNVKYDSYEYISAKENQNINRLVSKIDRIAFQKNHLVDMLIPHHLGSIYNLLKENANIITTDYNNEGIKIKVDLTDEQYHKYINYII